MKLLKLTIVMSNFLLEYIGMMKGTDKSHQKFTYFLLLFSIIGTASSSEEHETVPSEIVSIIKG